MSDTPSICRYEDATKFIESIQDPMLRAALEYALTTVVMRRDMNPAVSAAFEFDLRYFLEVIRAMFENKAALRAIIEGKDEAFRW